MAPVKDWPRSRRPAPIGLRDAVPTLMRKPTGILQGARWLFTWLALLSLLFSVPGLVATATANPLAVVLATGASVALVGSWMYSFLRQKVPFALEILDAAAITAFALSGPSPVATVAILFASVWLRSLYGSPWRSLARGALYGSLMLSVSLLGPLLPAHTAAPNLMQQVGVVSIVLLTMAVAGQLRGVLQSHDWAIERDQVLTQSGAQLLGLTDPHRIRGLAWSTARDLFSNTPGLRVLKVVRDGELLRAGPSIGQFSGGALTELPGTVVDCAGPVNEARIGDARPLDAAVGSALVWQCIALTEDIDDAWLLVGSPQRLPESIELSVRSLMNQVNLALRNSDAHRQLLAQAKSDALTHLDNRPSFTGKLGEQLTQNPLTSLHVLFLDLDDFKDVNDQLGHRAGDAVLIEVAARLRNQIRPHDVCARFGGDEFAVALVGTTDAAASAIAHRMVTSLAAPFIVNGLPVHVAASIGVASASPGIDLDELVHQADVAMYAAKANGKGQVTVFAADLLDSARSLKTFERQLSRAASLGELVVHYQPIVSLADRHCLGAEALVRWNHPDRGLLYPGDFVALAESSGTILTMGAFVLHQACADAAAWPEGRPGVPMTVAVNISARELESDHFVDSVLESLRDSGLPPTRLVLELTESVVLDSTAAVDRVKKLAGHGIRIALDDFGTGYSSLVALRSLPISIVKLDASFVAGALHNPVDHTVVKLIVQMSAELGMCTIAEGIETPEQQDLLAEMGADAAQGFLYCRGIPIAQFTDWIHSAASAEIVSSTSS